MKSIVIERSLFLLFSFVSFFFFCFGFVACSPSSISISMGRLQYKQTKQDYHILAKISKWRCRKAKKKQTHTKGRIDKFTIGSTNGNTSRLNSITIKCFRFRSWITEMVRCDHFLLSFYSHFSLNQINRNWHATHSMTNSQTLCLFFRNRIYSINAKEKQNTKEIPMFVNWKSSSTNNCQIY